MTTSNDISSSKKKGIIEWEIVNLDALKQLEPKALDIGGFHCEMKATLEGNKLVFWHSILDEIYGDNFWIFKTKMHLEVKEESTEMTAIFIKDWGSQYWMNYFYCELSTDVTQITAGTFPKMLRLHIELSWAPCQRSLPTVDAFLRIESILETDGIIYPRIPVNRHILAGYSTFFRKLFFDPGEEKQSPTTEEDGLPCYVLKVDVPGFNLIEFGIMLYGVQLLGTKVTELDCLQVPVKYRNYNWMSILSVAAKYELPMWLEHAKNMLIDTEPGTMSVLELAESLKLSALKKHCLKTMDALDYVKDFDSNQRIYGRLSEQTRLLVDARLKANACRYSRKRKRLDTEEDNDNDEEEE